MKTKQQIIDEEYEFRKTHDTCTDDHFGDCVYYREDGNMCLVGRCLKNPEDYNNCYDDIEYLLEEGGAEFKTEYDGHEISFWDDAQQLHDLGLTIPGAERIKLCDDFEKKWNVKLPL